MTEIIRLPQQARAAEVRAGSYNDQDNTIEVIWTTGATVRRVSWMDGEFDEELIVSSNAVRLDRLNSGAPFLDSHGMWSLSNVIGSVVKGSARIDSGKGVARILLSSAPDALDRVAKIKEGTVTNVSVGYRIHAVERKERDGAIPLHRVTDWEPWEISAVTVPADAGAQVRSSSSDEALFTCKVERSLADINAVRTTRMRMLHRQFGLEG